MAHSIQKRVKFSKGQIAPELVERTDLDIYDSSAQEITNLTSTIYGGLRTRRGTRYISDIYSSTETGTVTNNIGGNTSAIQDLGNTFTSGNISTTRDLIDIDYGQVLSSSQFVIKNIKTGPLNLVNTSSNTTYTVPSGIEKLHVDCVASRGAIGAGDRTDCKPGYGGRVQCDINVTDGQLLYITVGDIPSDWTTASYNASDIRIGGNAYSNRILVAGGGGSARHTSNKHYAGNGGNGGGTTGASGTSNNTSRAKGGTGGTQSAGGTGGWGRNNTGGNGTKGLGGNGGGGKAGAGGAGYYGGGGGGYGGHDGTVGHAGGGGGSSYANTTYCKNVVHTRGYRNGKGYIQISVNKIKIDIQTSQDNVTYTSVTKYNIGESGEDISVKLEDFRYVRVVLDAPSSINFSGSIKLDYIRLVSNLATNIKLIPYKFNNEQEYVIALSDQTIGIFDGETLVQEIAATGIVDSYLKDIKYTSKDDTIILTHKDMPPKQLQRTNAGWVLSAFPYTNIPYYAFNGETSTTKSVSITPSETEGSIKITAASSVFSASDVGQFIDGNGGRLRITEYTSNTVVKGVTVIPFYTTDAITSWKLISGYEAVWSANRGYPRTCLFAQQRLWFGGSRDLPSHVWASRINDYNNFKNAGNYDNDSIDITLLTNNPVVNMIEQRGIHIFTAGEEWTAVEDSLTPDKITIKCNSRNGSLSIEPVVSGGSVLYIEKNGKSLLGYLYNYEQASYTSDNLSILSNLLQAPVRMSIETNSNTDRGDFLFIVLADGTMLSTCISLSEKIFSISKFVTNGSIKDVCCLTSDTYVAVERSGYLYLEKLTFDRTDFTKTFYVDGDIISNMAEYDDYNVYISYEDKVDVYSVHGGEVELKEPYTGYITAGLGFSYRLESNPIAINNKTMTCKKRISKATVHCKDTERLEFNGQKKKGNDTFEFFACTPYKSDVRFVINGEYYPVNILSVTLDLNYEG